MYMHVCIRYVCVTCAVMHYGFNTELCKVAKFNCTCYLDEFISECDLLLEHINLVPKSLIFVSQLKHLLCERKGQVNKFKS